MCLSTHPCPHEQSFAHISLFLPITHLQILAMESIMLNTLNFQLTVPSALRFAERYIKVATAPQEVSFFTHYFLERTLQDYRFLNYLPSHVASAALYLAMRSMKHGSWDATMQKHTGYTESELIPCAKEILTIVSEEEPKYKAVKKKYSSQKFGGVAKIYLPANLIL